MKNLRQLCAALILTLALTVSALAGQMDCPGVTSTVPQATGTIECGITDVLLIMLALV
jgi:hypothetical protein